MRRVFLVDDTPLTTFISTTAATVVIMLLLLIPLSTHAAATFVLMFLLDRSFFAWATQLFLVE